MNSENPMLWKSLVDGAVTPEEIKSVEESRR
jgi:hypothetical protein